MQMASCVRAARQLDLQVAQSSAGRQEQLADGQVHQGQEQHAPEQLQQLGLQAAHRQAPRRLMAPVPSCSFGHQAR